MMEFNYLQNHNIWLHIFTFLPAKTKLKVENVCQVFYRIITTCPQAWSYEIEKFAKKACNLKYNFFCATSETILLLKMAPSLKQFEKNGPLQTLRFYFSDYKHQVFPIYCEKKLFFLEGNGLTLFNFNKFVQNKTLLNLERNFGLLRSSSLTKNYLIVVTESKFIVYKRKDFSRVQTVSLTIKDGLSLTFKDKGLIKTGPNELTFVDFEAETQEKVTVDSNCIFSTLHLSKDFFYIATIDTGIYRYTLKTWEKIHLDTKCKILKIHELSSDKLLLLNEEGKIILLNLQTNDQKILQEKDPSNPFITFEVNGIILSVLHKKGNMTFWSLKTLSCIFFLNTITGDFSQFHRLPFFKLSKKVFVIEKEPNYFEFQGILK